MKDNRKEVMRQLAFCNTLFAMLNHDINESDAFFDDRCIANYTRHQADIVRLRRELLRLGKMLNPYDNHRYV